jgi:hypothetical protein
MSKLYIKKSEDFPQIKKIGTSPSPAIVGNPLTFEVVLDKKLSSDEQLKINYGAGDVTMFGTGNNYTITATPPKNVTLYSVGIYDKNGRLKSPLLSSNWQYLKEESQASVSVVQSRRLALAANTERYKQIGFDGSSPPKRLRDWACTLDTQTNLMWEVKTADKGIHDKNWTYSWYDPSTIEPYANENPVRVCKNYNQLGVCTSYVYEVLTYPASRQAFYGFVAGTQNGGKCLGTSCDTDALVQATNSDSLCGSTNWRLPTKEELMGLLYCSNGVRQSIDTTKTTAMYDPQKCVDDALKSQYASYKNTTVYKAIITRLRDECTRYDVNEGGYYCKTPLQPNLATIDNDFFQNTNKSWYWTSTVPRDLANTAQTTTTSVTANSNQSSYKKTLQPTGINYAWAVTFYYGQVNRYGKGNAIHVRLVSAAK